MSGIYEPSEDSYLMSEILKKEVPELLKKKPAVKILEIGAGSGIHLETLFRLGVKKQNIFSVDIDRRAVTHCNLLGFNCIHSDLFEKVEGKFDFIIFNPPYLPEDSREPCDSQTATTGGKNGCEIINKFLKDAKNYLVPDGRIFLITSSLTKDIDWLDYNKKQIGCEKLFFEQLCVHELSEKNFFDK
jgi:release factor glutamine methyltransferase